jgi:hypothetical protein
VLGESSRCTRSDQEIGVCIQYSFNR